MSLTTLAVDRIGLEIYLAVSYFHDFSVEDGSGFGPDSNRLTQILPGQISPCYHRHKSPTSSRS